MLWKIRGIVDTLCRLVPQSFGLLQSYVEKKVFSHETVDSLNFNICLKEPSLNLLGFLEFLPHSRALLNQREERVCHLSSPESNSLGSSFASFFFSVSICFWARKILLYHQAISLPLWFRGNFYALSFSDLAFWRWKFFLFQRALLLQWKDSIFKTFVSFFKFNTPVYILYWLHCFWMIHWMPLIEDCDERIMGKRKCKYCLYFLSCHIHFGAF